MSYSTLCRLLFVVALSAFLPLWPQVSLTSLGTKYTQDFNTLASTGTSNTTLPTGWLIFEAAGATSTGGRVNQQYAADDGGSPTGDVYSYGSTTADRAYGTLRSGAISPFIGASFTNNTGSTITSLEIAYKGEQWRLGASNRTGGTTRDVLRFEYSAVATALGAGTYTGVSALDFNAVLDGVAASGSAGARNGNAAANSTNISGTISGLSIAPGKTFFIRWVDFDVTGSDDGLAIDDFELTPKGSSGPSTPTLSISNASITEGDTGTKLLNFNVTLTAAAPAAVNFKASTTDVSATAPSDFVALTNAPFSIAAGDTGTTVSVTINGDTTVEPDETFTVTISDLTGALAGTLMATGTILNDDIATTPISSIQGPGASSPLTGTVTTRGVVTAITSNGFFIQTPTTEADADPLTSEGIFIFTGSAGTKPSSTGRLVRVTGVIEEFSSDDAGATLTELSGSPTFVDLGAAPIPDPVDLPAAAFDPAQPLLDAPTKLEFLERYESMRVRTPGMRSVTATATNGVFYAVPSTYSGLPFREPGVERTTRFETNVLPAVMPAGAPRFDMNPEVLGVDTDGLSGVSSVIVAFGSSLPQMRGVLTYSSRGFMLFPESGQVPASTPVTATPVRAPGACEFTVASMNLERFGETSGTTYTNLINKIANAVINHLRLPDVIAVQESTSLSNLNDLAARILAVSGTQYAALLIPTSNDIIHNGILFRTSRVTKIGMEQLRFVADILPADGTDLFDRPPLVAEFTVSIPGCGSKTFTVVANHLKSLIGLDDAGSAGARDRQKRRLEAERVADLMQEINTKSALTLGDFNAFEVNDAYVDVMATIMGTPTPATQVLDASIDIWSHTLQNLTYMLPASRRYTYMFNGDHQVLDHVLVNDGMFANLTGYEVLHTNADFPGSFKNSTTVGERYSDHDNPIAYFVVPAPALVGGSVRFSGFRLNAANNTIGTTGVFTNTTGAPIAGPLFLVLDGLSAGKIVVNATGQYQGKPHVKVFDGASLAPGATATFPIVFANTPGGINFTPRVYTAKF
jgi:predicted extracellular nuclease